MQKLRSKLFVLAVVGILAVVGTIISSRNAKAAGGGPTVTIGDPLPLPVTGTVNVVSTNANPLIVKQSVQNSFSIPPLKSRSPPRAGT